MSSKIEVKICVCTLCSVMGGSDLQLLGDYLPEGWDEHVSISGAMNLTECHGAPGEAKPPFASVDGSCIARASIVSVVDAIRQRMKAKGLATD